MRNKFLCSVVVAPIRALPSHKAEMISQLLFGEAVEMVDEMKDFVLVKCMHDGYEGWIQAAQLTPIAVDFDTTVVGYCGTNSKILAPETAFSLSIGSPIYKEQSLHLGETNYHYQIKNETPANVSLIQTAMLFLYTPYLWGGRSSFGIDCSGLVQQVCRMHGVKLPRDSADQAVCGVDVGFLSEARDGDLAFFDNEEGKIIHVGILLGNDRIIHASGRVRIDPIDSHGIIHNESKKRTHKLRTIRRILP